MGTSISFHWILPHSSREDPRCRRLRGHQPLPVHGTMTTQTTLDYLGCLPANFMPGVSLPGLRSLREDKQGVKGVATPLSLGPSLSLGSLPANEHIVGQGHDGHECAHDSDHG